MMEKSIKNIGAKCLGCSIIFIIIRKKRLGV